MTPQSQLAQIDHERRRVIEQILRARQEGRQDPQLIRQMEELSRRRVDLTAG